MAPETDVPWAEIVPDAPFPMTVADYERWSDDGPRYELVRGRLVKLPFGSFGRGVISGNLIVALANFVDTHHLGDVLSGKCGFHLPLPEEEPHETLLMPTCSFVRADRVPTEDELDWGGIWKGAPDLIVEVAEYEQPRLTLAAKVRLWVAAGVRLVWVVWPSEKLVEVWVPGRDEPAQVLKPGEQLDRLEAVPGFSYPVADLFEEGHHL